jgi:hypothetical protein
MISQSTPNHNLRALIFGASGITGWGIARAALSYPTPETFDQVIGLTNRPMSKDEAFLPEDSRLKLYSGVDLSKSVGEIAEALKNIHGVDKTTHVYFSGGLMLLFPPYDASTNHHGKLMSILVGALKELKSERSMSTCWSTL